jgi:hypothetical protein
MIGQKYIMIVQKQRQRLQKFKKSLKNDCPKTEAVGKFGKKIFVNVDRGLYIVLESQDGTFCSVLSSVVQCCSSEIKLSAVLESVSMLL